MKKWERDAIDARIEVLFEKSKITEAESYNMESLADIAYQLTRIADRGDTEEKIREYRKLLKHASKQHKRHLDLIEDLTAKLATVPKPAPDVELVEAVRNHIRANDAKYIGRLTEEEMEPLKNALAAHKPEVQ